MLWLLVNWAVLYAGRWYQFLKLHSERPQQFHCCVCCCVDRESGLRRPSTGGHHPGEAERHQQGGVRPQRQVQEMQAVADGQYCFLLYFNKQTNELKAFSPWARLQMVAVRSTGGKGSQLHVCRRVGQDGGQVQRAAEDQRQPEVAAGGRGGPLQGEWDWAPPLSRPTPTKLDKAALALWLREEEAFDAVCPRPCAAWTLWQRCLRVAPAARRRFTVVYVVPWKQTKLSFEEIGSGCGLNAALGSGFLPETQSEGDGV